MRFELTAASYNILKNDLPMEKVSNIQENSRGVTAEIEINTLEELLDFTKRVYGIVLYADGEMNEIEIYDDYLD